MYTHHGRDLDMEHEFITHIVSIIIPFVTLGITIISLRLLANKDEAKNAKKKAKKVYEYGINFSSKIGAEHNLHKENDH